MKVVFLSNFFNHHQRPLSDALAARCSYAFLAAEPMPPERRALGWGGGEPDYVCRLYSDPERAKRLLAEADVVIAGAAPESLVLRCIRRGQLVFRYSERPLKNGPEPLKFLPRFLRWHWRNPPGKKIYLLSAGAYAAGDYARFGLFRGKVLRWGYFPEVRQLPPENRRGGSILWAGRLLELKHPEQALHTAAELKKAGLDFTMTIIGDGPLRPALENRIRREKLEDRVRLTGILPPEQVRREMEQSDIFLFTSDCREGWGAVLSEAMASGCAAVACDAAGAAPYLIRNGENGFLYRYGNDEALTEYVKRLLREPGLSQSLGAEAHRTMASQWNAETAATRFLAAAQGLLDGKGLLIPWQDGPCSPAEDGG